MTAVGITVGILLILGGAIWQPSIIGREPFEAPAASYDNWNDILDNPGEISLSVYSTGTNATQLSGIINLEHESAGAIDDVVIDIPVIANVVQHDRYGAYLVDAGLDSSYVDNPFGTMRGVLVGSFLATGSQEPGQHIAGALEREDIRIQGVFLTHLHFDHTAGIVDLPKDIPYMVGKGEPYRNFRFIIQGDHLAGVEELQEIDCDAGVDLSPLGKGIDVLGDGSFWAISSPGHSPGHILYFVNGTDGQYLLTGDACNNLQQFETGIGPGFYSSDLEEAQLSLDQIIAFKEMYPEVTLVFGHDLETL